MRGRITLYCIAESINRKRLEAMLRERGGRFLVQPYPEVLYGQVRNLLVATHLISSGCGSFYTMLQEQFLRHISNGGRAPFCLSLA